MVIPESGNFIAQIVYFLIGWLTPAVGYGVAIIIFAIILRTAMLPLDWTMKYFQKRNALIQAELKPEVDELAQTHAGDQMALYRAKQQLMRKKGGGMTGFCVVSIINMAITLLVFWSVFQAFARIGDYNNNHQFIQMRQEHQAFMIENNIAYNQQLTDEQTAELRERLNYVHAETTISFLWVRNMWRPETPWSSQTLNFSQFENSVSRVTDGVLSPMYGMDDDEQEAFTAALRAEYNMLFGYIDANDRNWNGLGIFILLAAATSFLAVWVNSLLMPKPVKKTAEERQAEEEAAAGYSIRDAKNKGAGAAKPTAAMPDTTAMSQKMMKYMMPVMMVIFTLNTTSALAIYIVFSSVVSSTLAFGGNAIISKILRRQKAKRKDDEPDMTIINPHAKYFKTKKK